MLKLGNIKIIRYSDMALINKDLIRRLKILNKCNIDVLFDIGAADGHYAKTMRQFGFTKKIISFEPLKSSFEELKKAASKDSNWLYNNYALGNENSNSVMNVAGNSDSSSILKMLPMHLKSAPESRYIAQQEIEIKKFDSVINSFCNREDRIMLKIDTQGYEKKVLEGANNSLDRICVIQLEMSIVPLYENELLFSEMIDFMTYKHFKLFSLENGFSNRNTGQLLQVDGIFVKNTLAN
jgi:FkbM family methyltransferase